MSKDDEASRIALLLNIRYTHAVRLIRAAAKDLEATVPFSDLALACRRIKEEEEKRRKQRLKGALPKGAGAVRCIPCGAESRADGKGSPIVLKHTDDCPERYPIKDHRYDAGHPRDDSKGCVALVNDAAFWEEEAICGRPLSEHAHSEYAEDGR